ncbi:MAG: hypothetical protein PWQ49_90 [Methanohalophilus sp.]|nr:hypothetical protein [Methanohalophilus sp.]
MLFHFSNTYDHLSNIQNPLPEGYERDTIFLFYDVFCEKHQIGIKNSKKRKKRIPPLSAGSIIHLFSGGQLVSSQPGILPESVGPIRTFEPS